MQCSFSCPVFLMRTVSYAVMIYKEKRRLNTRVANAITIRAVRKEDQRKRERVVRPGTDPGDNSVVPEDPPPSKQVLKLHVGLKKAESSMLVQARTGRVGLAKYLYSRKVPRILTAQCRCEAGEETVHHIALYYTDETEHRQCLRMNGRLNYGRLIGTASGVKRLTEWMIHSGRLG